MRSLRLPNNERDVLMKRILQTAARGFLIAVLLSAIIAVLAAGLLTVSSRCSSVTGGRDDVRFLAEEVMGIAEGVPREDDSAEENTLDETPKM